MNCGFSLGRRALGALAWLTVLLSTNASEAVWQWSTPIGEGRAFLWIPENCAQVRGVMFAQHNMIEEGILEHPTMRRTLAELGFAEVFVAPPSDRVFDFHRDAHEHFEALMHALADESGYKELATAPVVPMGHSACASFPWNFAAGNPARTIAVLSIKGDAPQTNLTGSGAPNPDWGDRTINGIPGLMVMSEQEWWEARLAPLVTFRRAYPASPLAVLADAGRGHFDASDELVEFLAMFVRKAAEARLGSSRSEGVQSVAGSALRPVDPSQGWLIDRWRADGAPRAAAAPAANYVGDRAEAFWCFDEEHAQMTEVQQARSRGKKRQQVAFVQENELAPISTTHVGVELEFRPEDDGMTFRLGGDFIVPLPARPPTAAKDQPPPPTTVHPVRAAPGSHPSGAVRISRITGPVAQIDPTTFRVQLGRTASTRDQRNLDVWLLASHAGGARFKPAVQQARLRVMPGLEGAEQRILFPEIADRPAGGATVKLAATSDTGLPVQYYVREGPAFVRNGVLYLTAIPPRAKLPVKVTVVAWQLGRVTEPKVQRAESVERSFRVGGLPR